MASNSFFQFKQFKINQVDVAMKVTTEGCILGAWAGKVSLRSPRKILDIGTGTGLLALMVAQVFSEAEVVAVEVNEAAAVRAMENFSSSPWKDRLQIKTTTVQKLQTEPFDLIVANPPFFRQSLKSPTAEINLARHDTSLSQQDLVMSLSRLLGERGEAVVLYPKSEAEVFQQLAKENGLFPRKKLIVKDRENGPVLRVIAQYTRSVSKMTEDELVIRQANRDYTPEFVQLLKPYYLYL